MSSQSAAAAAAPAFAPEGTPAVGKLRVLYVITRAERGGAQVHVLDLLRGLRAETEPELAVGEEGFLAGAARSLGIACHVVPSLVQPISPLRDLQALTRLTALIRRRRPHVVHAHTSKAGLLGRLAAAANGVPSVFTAHTWCFSEGTSWTWRVLGLPLERLGGALSAAVINVSEANRKLALLRHVAAPQRLFTIHNGIPSLPLQANHWPNAQPTVIMVARFAPQKDHVTLLKALAQMKQSFRLQLVGDGPTEQEVARLCESLGLQASVEFLGKRSDVSALLARADIFALISNWEGFPISILEAMRAGLPIIASDVGGVREAVTPAVNGYLTRPGSVEDVCEALAALLESPTRRAVMGARSRQLFEQKFRADAMLGRTLQVYRKAVSSTGDESPVMVGTP